MRECPTLCDPDCEAACHEVHQVRWKRAHEPEDCPSNSPDEHRYISTACHHALHDDCRKTCKFCASTCLCECHEDGGTA